MIKIHVLHGRRRGFHVSIREEQELHALQGEVKERELSWMREVPSGPIGCASAALSEWVVERREIQTGDISLHEPVRPHGSKGVA